MIVGGKKHSNPVRACLITSARSGSGEFQLSEVLPVLLAQGWDVAVKEKREKGDAIRLARKAVEEGYDPIVNCGGDGTLNEIVEALTGSDVAVGTVPGGTVNVWSKEIDVSQRSRVAATQLVASERVKVDVGQVEINGKHRQHFLMMAGLGTDAAVMGHVSRSLKTRLGPIAVGVAAFETLPSLKAMPIRVTMDGIRWEGKVTQFIAGNTRRYGGFTRITPEAYADDGLLDICLFTTDGLLGAGRQMTSMLVRQQPSEASAEMYRAAHVTVDAPASLPLQLDGSAIDQKEHAGDVRYVFSVVPRGITVLVPRTYDGALFEHGMSPNGLKPKKGKGKKRKHGEH
ncbi:MAG: diacylglycerol kinase family lipid kinase [Chloroflexota bacterium]